MNNLEIDIKTVPDGLKTKFKKLIQEYSLVFAQTEEKLTFNTNIKAVIRTLDSEPVYSKPRPYPMADAPFVNSEIRRLLDNGIIQPSRSPYNTPVLVVGKNKFTNDGNPKLRLVFDYRKLNERTISDRYPIPESTVILSNLGQAKYYSTIDLRSGFHQILLEEKDREKTAFSINNGKYEFCRLPFGLKNGPSIFQRAIDDVLRSEIGKSCHVYIDDVIIFSATAEKHLQDIENIFKKLLSANMRISSEKCKFFKVETEFLGFLISSDGIKTCPNKVNDIIQFEQPKSLRALRSFLGLAGYYRRFVKDYAEIAKPLTKYLRGENGNVGTNQSKNVRISFDTEAVGAFNRIKNILASEDVLLLYPDFKKPFDLTTDASSHAIGAVLSQTGRPITMISRTLSKTEEAYATNEREMLAIVWALQALRNYLYGAPNINIYTDHQPLTFAISDKNPNTKLKRWRAFIEEYSPVLHYKPGKDNKVADALSRQHIYSSLVSENTVHSEESLSEVIPSVSNPINSFKNQIFIEESLEDSRKFKTIFQKQTRHLIKFTTISNLIKTIKDALNPEINNGIYCPLQVLGRIQNSLILAFPKIKMKYTNKQVQDIFNRDDQDSILADEHNRAHRALSENYKQINSEYYFPDLKKRLKAFVSKCRICKENKYQRRPQQHPLGPTPIPNYPGEILHLDIYNTGKKYFITCIDKFSKYAVVKAIASRNTTDIKNPLIEIISQFNNPKLIVTDNEGAFTSNIIRSMLQNEFNISLFTVPALHSQSNGQVERFHSTLSEIARCTKDNTSDIHELILLATYKYNETIHSVVGYKPKYIFHSTDRTLKEEIIQILRTTQKQDLDYHNKGAISKTFQPGDKVYLKTNKRLGNKLSKLYNLKTIQADLGTAVVIDGRQIHKNNLR